MRVTCFSTESNASNLYYISKDDRQCGVIVDPSLSPEFVFDRLGFRPRITEILLTHGHFDHILCLDEWRKETGAPLAVGRYDAQYLQMPSLSLFSYFGENRTFAKAERLLDDGDLISVGDEALTVVTAPGHTPGSVLYRTDDFIIVGDVVFADGGYGRVDFPLGDADTLRITLKKLFSFPDNPILYSGHGPSSHLRTEATYPHL